MSMETVYVVGHRNPDTDSIISAMAYASLYNALGDRRYVAARLGNVSDETKMVLDRFGYEPPVRIHSVRTQVRDLAFDTPPALNTAVTVSRAWDVLQQNPSIPALPVVDEQAHLQGMLTADEIAGFDMRSIACPVIEDVPMFNLLSVLEGHILNESEDLARSVSGDVVIALPKAHGVPIYNNTGCVLLCGQQPDVIQAAIADGVRTLILCQAEIDKELLESAGNTCVISTPYDITRASRLIYHAIPVARICARENIVCFHLDDFIDDVREVVLQNRTQSYPILDDGERVVGTLSRYHLLRPRRKKVVLVDHNEAAQSVPGLEQAEVLAIIDHHRLADIETSGPVFFRNEPVGSTATIISTMYQEKGIVPTEKMAGLLASAIVSDTVIFKSPTCTERDRHIAASMARIAGLSLDELGHDIFSAATSDSKSEEDLLFTDYKEFHIAGHALGIGQVTCINSEHVLKRREKFLELMRNTREEKKYDMILLMLTDVLREGTELLFIGDEEIIRQAFNVDVNEGACFLPRIMSRKKQVVPMLSVLWG